MAENGSVGMISLDLVIKEKLTEQLDKIKARVSAPAAKVGETMQSAVEKPMTKVGEKVGKAVETALKQAESAIGNGIDEAVAKATKRYEDQYKEIEDVADKAASIEFVLPKADKISDSIKQPIAEAVEESKKKLNEFSGFEVAGDPAERLNQKIETSYEKLSLLQKKWQELSNAGSDDKIVSQLNATERQIISINEQLEKYQEQLKKYQEQISKPIAFDFELPQAASEKLSQSVENSAGKIDKLKSTAGSAFSAIKKTGGKAFGFLKNTGEKALNSLKSRFSHLGSSALSVSKPVSKLGKCSKTRSDEYSLLQAYTPDSGR